MSNFSTNGLEWAKRSELKAGSRIRTDNGFTCGIKSQVLDVGKNQNGLYVMCQDGFHYLDGQLADDDDHLIGIWPDNSSDPNIRRK